VLERENEKVEFPVKWDIDLQSEHERYLTEKYAKKPVIVMNYPKVIKAFYMRVPQRVTADPPWMKPWALRCPGEGRDPSTRCSCRRQMDPGFRRGSVQRCLPLRTVLFLVS
jgi:hypothetical protein